MGYCERCERECDGLTCPVCGGALLQEVDPEAMPQRYEVPLHGALQMKIEGTQSAEYFALADMVVE